MSQAIHAEDSVNSFPYYIRRIGKPDAWNQGGESRFSPL